MVKPNCHFETVRIFQVSITQHCSHQTAGPAFQKLVTRGRELQRTEVDTIDGIIFFFCSFGPSGVCVLPLAAGRNEGGNYFRYIFLLLVVVLFLPPLFKTTEGVVVGFQIFAWAPK